MNIVRPLSLILVSWSFAAFAHAQLRAQEEPAEKPAEIAKVDFAEQIKPILETRCLECHGPDLSESELRLDSKEAMFKGGDSGEALIPGKADESLIVELIALPEDDPGRMPNDGDPLSAEQIELVKNWINQGADWPEGVIVASPEDPLPDGGFLAEPGLEITESEEAVVTGAREQGALAMRIAENTNWLRIDYSIGAKETADADLAHLIDAQNLVELDLGGTKITDEGLAHLAGLTNLVRLHLENTAVTGAGLAHLAELPRLEYLNLFGTQVSDEALEHLRGLGNLKRLYLWQTNVTDEGAARLTEALPELYVNRGIEEPAVAEEEAPAEEAAGEEGADAEAESAKEEGAAEPEAEEEKADD